MSVLQSAVDPGAPAFAANRERVDALVAALRQRVFDCTAGGRPAHVTRHRDRGKLLPRERIDRLVDPGTPFFELSPLAAWGQYGNEVPGAGIVTGIGRVRDTLVVIIANDATVKGGSFFHETVKKHVRAQ